MSPDGSGVEAPTMPVFAPCGTTRMPCAEAKASTRATSSVVLGRTAARARPWP
jgi:hypothetical protein